MLTYAIASKQNSSAIEIKERERETEKKNTKVMLVIFHSTLKLTVKVNLLLISLWVVEYYPHHRWMLGQGGVQFIITYSIPWPSFMKKSSLQFRTGQFLE